MAKTRLSKFQASPSVLKDFLQYYADLSSKDAFYSHAGHGNKDGTKKTLMDGLKEAYKDGYSTPHPLTTIKG